MVNGLGCCLGVIVDVIDLGVRLCLVIDLVVRSCFVFRLVVGNVRSCFIIVEVVVCMCVVVGFLVAVVVNGMEIVVVGGFIEGTRKILVFIVRVLLSRSWVRRRGFGVERSQIVEVVKFKGVDDVIVIITESSSSGSGEARNHGHIRHRACVEYGAIRQPNHGLG